MKNRKLTAKKILVVVLAVILFIICISSSTFSWFKTRPNSNSGGKLSLTLPLQEGGINAELKSYDGSGVTMNTYVSRDDGITFDSTAAAPATSGTLGTTSPSNRIYYKTEIINGKTTPQNVSLYIKNFATGGQANANVCVGTNEPVKSFKNYSLMGVTIPSPTKVTANATTKRIYFKPVSEVPSGNKYDGHRTNWSPPSGIDPTDPYYYVRSGNNGSYSNSTRFYRCTESSDNVWYADIPWGDNQLYISVTADGSVDYQRTQNFTDLYGDGLSTSQSLCFYTNGSYTDYNNAWAGKYTCTGANVATFYNNITISNVNGQEVSVALDNTTTPPQYTSQAAIKYYSSDQSIFTINEDTGVITPVGAGNAYVVYRVTSDYGESRDFGSDTTTKVTVNNVNTSTATIKSAPIVTNLMLSAATNEGQVNTDKSNVQTVYWFIQNGDPMYGMATANGTYTLDGIYLGL